MRVSVQKSISSLQIGFNGPLKDSKYKTSVHNDISYIKDLPIKFPYSRVKKKIKSEFVKVER